MSVLAGSPRLTSALLCLLGLVLPHRAGAQVPIPGQGVAVDVELREDGSWHGEMVELLSGPRKLSVRAPIEAANAELRLVRVLGLWISIEETATGANPATPRPFPTVGDWVELKIDNPAGPELIVLELERDDIKETHKIKGTITAVVNEEGRSTIFVHGLPILVDDQTDWDHEANGLFDELFGVLKSDDIIGEDPGYRQLGSRIFVSGSVRPIGRVEDSFSLQSNGDELVGIGEPSARLEMMAALPAGVTLFAQGQIRSRYELHYSERDTRTQSSSPQLQLRQLFVSVPSLFDLPVGITAGKQRVRDNREFLFDEYLDGIRIYAYPFQPLVIEASLFFPVMPLKDRFETWTDAFLRAQWFAADDWTASVYALRRWDTDPRRGRDVQYYGASLDGRYEFLKVWGNGALLRGEDKGNPQEAYAWDVGLALRARRMPLRPGVSVSLARGSGDRDPSDGVSNEFRQTGYEDNSSRVWGFASFRHFGEALDPELSNIRIQTASFGVRSSSRFGIDLVAHRYVLDQLTDEFDNVGLHLETQEVLNEQSHELGLGGDLVLAVRDLFPSTHFTYKVGVFQPGKAFDIDTDLAWLHKLEFRIDF